MQGGRCVKDRKTEIKPAIVPEKAKQAGEIRDRWSWVEPEVWTERMLTALEKGVRGGKWFSLIDKIYPSATLRKAFQQVKANKGVAGIDNQTIEMFERQLDKNLNQLSEELLTGRYRPQAIKRKEIPKPGSKEKRPLGIPTVRDRIVQGAVRMVIEPIFEKEFCDDSYGFRPERSCKDALRRVDELLKSGNTWVLDADLKSYFDTISHSILLEHVEARISDGRVIDLIKAFLKQEVMETARNWIPEEGTPQGGVISPLLSNIYLDPLDQEMSHGKVVMVRYADDFVVLCKSEKDALYALKEVTKWTSCNGLMLHTEKTHVVDATQKGGFDFLGYHFERGYRWPRKKSLKKLKDTIRSQTKRTNGTSLEVIISKTNVTLKGWFNYFKHSHYTTFKPLDQWIRMRLRSILRKRKGGRGRGRGSDHQRWPNAFFAEKGLFSLSAAYSEACQSSMR